MTVKERIEHSRTGITKLVFPQDTNPIGMLYGGTAMKWMDEVAFLTATRFARRPGTGHPGRAGAGGRRRKHAAGQGDA